MGGRTVGSCLPMSMRPINAESASQTTEGLCTNKRRRRGRGEHTPGAACRRSRCPHKSARSPPCPSPCPAWSCCRAGTNTSDRLARGAPAVVCDSVANAMCASHARMLTREGRALRHAHPHAFIALNRRLLLWSSGSIGTPNPAQILPSLHPVLQV